MEYIRCFCEKFKNKSRTLPSNTTTFYLETCQKEVTEIPVQAYSGPEGSRKMRFLDFKTVGK